MVVLIKQYATANNDYRCPDSPADRITRYKGSKSDLTPRCASPSEKWYTEWETMAVCISSRQGIISDITIEI